MINCWAIGRKAVRVAHRNIHRVIHRIRHHYHSPAVKIVAPAIVCVGTAAELAPWLIPTQPVAGAQAPPAASLPSSVVPFGAPAATFPANAIPLGAGIFGDL